MRILLIAKLNDAWMKVRDQLSVADREVITLSACRQGLKTLRNDSDIDVVIVDVESFKSSAIKLLESVKSDPRLNPIPVIMAGNSFTDATMSTYLNAGVDDIILVPVDRNTLEAKIRRAVRDGKRTVLVVDDEPLIVDLLKDFLQLERYRVLTAGNAEEALDILKEESVNVVVSDIGLPGMTGTGLLAKVKTYYPLIPVILITGFSERFTPEMAIAAGADGYFSKPFHNLDLSYTLKQVISKYAHLGLRKPFQHDPPEKAPASS